MVGVAVKVVGKVGRNSIGCIFDVFNLYQVLYRAPTKPIEHTQNIHTRVLEQSYDACLAVDRGGYHCCMAVVHMLPAFGLRIYSSRCDRAESVYNIVHTTMRNFLYTVVVADLCRGRGRSRLLRGPNYANYAILVMPFITIVNANVHHAARST